MAQSVPISQTKPRVGVIYDERFLQHQGPTTAFDKPERLTAIIDLLHEEQLLQMEQLITIDPEPATDAVLKLAHIDAHLARVHNAVTRLRDPSAGAGSGGEDWPCSKCTRSNPALCTHCQLCGAIRGTGGGPAFALVNDSTNTKSSVPAALKDDSTYVCSRSEEVARLAGVPKSQSVSPSTLTVRAVVVGAAVTGVRALISSAKYTRDLGHSASAGDVGGVLQHALCLVRPPGHHATSTDPQVHSNPIDSIHNSFGTQMQGFCLYNNVAVAALDALSHPTVERVAIVDLDVHHGNGTQAILQGRDNIFFASVHRHDKGKFYPYSGARLPHSRSILNLPLPCTGCGDAEYLLLLKELIVPALAAFGPDLLVVSAGFDMMEGDYVGRMGVSAQGVFHMTRMLMALRTPSGRPMPLCCVLEGGYNYVATAHGCVAMLRALLGQTDPEVLHLCGACSDPYAGGGMMTGASRQQQRAHAAVVGFVQEVKRDQQGLHN